MESLIEEMFKCGFDLKSDGSQLSNEEAELVRFIEKHKEKLAKLLRKEENEILEKLIDCQDEYWAGCCREEFISGFRLGGRLVMEIIFGSSELYLQR